MDIKKIYIDLDGVLADFDRGVKEILGLEPHVQGAATKEEDDYLYQKMRQVEHFYGSLEPMEGAISMFNTLYAEFGSKVEILSGIPKPKRGIINAESDKREWVKKYLSDKLVANIVLRKDKPLLCKGAEYILIDDFAVNIGEWESEGGTGVLHVSPEETIAKIHELKNR